MADLSIVDSQPLPQAQQGALTIAKSEPLPSPPSALSRFGHGLYETTIGPLRHPIDSTIGALKTMTGWDDFDKIADAVKNEDYAGAAGLIGKHVAEGPQGRLGHAIVDPISGDIASGNYAGAAGRVLGTGASLAAPEVLGRIPAVARASNAVSAGARAAAPDVMGGAAQIAAGEAIGRIPGMEWPGRIALGYPGIRQLSRAAGKFASAAKSSYQGAAADKLATATAEAGAPAAETGTTPTARPPVPEPAAPGKTAADLFNEEMAAKAQPPAAPEAPPTPVKSPGQVLYESNPEGTGGTPWEKVPKPQKAMFEQFAQGQAQQAAEAPPPSPTQSAPPSAQPASVAPTSISATPAPTPPKVTAIPKPAAAPTPEAADIDFQMRHGEAEQPEVAKFLGYDQPKPASEAPSAKETAANIAKAKYAQAKADRFVKAIQDYNAKYEGQPITADAITALDDSDKALLARNLSKNGVLPAIDANKFPNTSWPYIVTKLRQAEHAAR